MKTTMPSQPQIKMWTPITNQPCRAHLHELSHVILRYLQHTH